jgi:hypothetical protein
VNNKLGLCKLKVGNTLAYYDTATITTVKGFTVQARDVSCLMTLMIPFHFSVIILLRRH